MASKPASFAQIDTKSLALPLTGQGINKHYIPEPNTFVADMLALEPHELEKYKLFVQYLDYSPTFTKLDWFLSTQGTVKEMTPDQLLVYQMILSFRSVSFKNWQAWWDQKGKYALGRSKSLYFQSSNFDLEKLQMTYRDNWHCIVFPSSLTFAEGMKELKTLQSQFKPKIKSKQQFSGKYRLMKSGMRNDYLKKGLIALDLFKRGYKNWEIGNAMKLVPSCCFDQSLPQAQKRGAFAAEKNALGAAARRLITDATRVAENAARGRFPTGAKFPEEDLSAYQRR